MKNPVETENPISFDEACRGNPNKYLLQIKLISTCSVKAHIDPGESEGGGDKKLAKQNYSLCGSIKSLTE